MSRRLSLLLLDFFCPWRLDDKDPLVLPAAQDPGEGATQDTTMKDSNIVGMDLLLLKKLLTETRLFQDSSMSASFSAIAERLLEIEGICRAGQSDLKEKSEKVLQRKLIKDLESATIPAPAKPATSTPAPKDTEKHPLDNDEPFVISESMRRDMEKAKQDYDQMLENIGKRVKKSIPSLPDDIKSILASDPIDPKLSDLVKIQEEEAELMENLKRELELVKKERDELLLLKQIQESTIREKDSLLKQLESSRAMNEATRIVESNSVSKVDDLKLASRSESMEPVLQPRDFPSSLSFTNSQRPSAKQSMENINIKLENDYPDEIRLSDENIASKTDTKETAISPSLSAGVDKISDEKDSEKDLAGNFEGLKSSNEDYPSTLSLVDKMDVVTSKPETEAVEDLAGNFEGLKSSNVDYPSTLSLVDKMDVVTSKPDAETVTSTSFSSPPAGSFAGKVTRLASKKSQGSIENWSDDIELEELPKKLASENDGFFDSNSEIQFPQSSSSTSIKEPSLKPEADNHDLDDWEKDFEADETAKQIQDKSPAKAIKPQQIHNLAAERAAKKASSSSQQQPKPTVQDDSWEDDFDDGAMEKLGGSSGSKDGSRQLENPGNKPRRKMSQESYYANPIFRNDPKVNATLKRKSPVKKKSPHKKETVD